MTATDLPVIEAWLRRARRDSLVMDGVVAAALIGVTYVAVDYGWWVIRLAFSGSFFAVLCAILLSGLIATAVWFLVLSSRWLPRHVRGMQALWGVDIPATAQVLVALYAAPASVPVHELARLVPRANIEAIATVLIGLAAATPVAVPHEALVLPVERRDALEAEIRRP